MNFVIFLKTEKLPPEFASGHFGKIIGKFKGMENTGCNTYTKLYNACIATIFNYGVGGNVITTSFLVIAR